MLTLKKKISLAALMISLIAFVMAISTSRGGVIYQEEKLSLTEKGKGFLKEKIFGKDKQVIEDKSGVKIDHTGVFSLSLVAVIIGILTIFIKDPKVRKERSGLQLDFNITGAALALGFTALLWNYILIAIIIAIVLYIFSSLASSGIDIGI